jgi:hypothetical protein
MGQIVPGYTALRLYPCENHESEEYELCVDVVDKNCWGGVGVREGVLT